MIQASQQSQNGKPGGVLSARCLLLIVAAGLVVQLLLLCFHRNATVLCDDESAFLANTRLLMQHGLTHAFFVNMKGQGFGPLLNIIHFCAAPVTNLAAPQVRVLHLILTVIFFVTMFVTLRRSLPEVAGPLALSFAAIPMLWHQSGGVWSHIPTIIAALAAMHLLLLALTRLNTSCRAAMAMASVAGCLYGVAILGRATFLAPLACLPLLFIGQSSRRSAGLILGIFFLLAITVSAPAFIAWKGLVPPDQVYIARGLSFWHMTLNFFYGFLIVVLVSPAWLELNRKSIAAMLVITVFAFFVTAIWLKLPFRPLGSLVTRALPGTALKIYDLIFPAFIAGLAAGLVVAFVRFALRHKEDGQLLFLGASAFAMLLSSLTVTFYYASDYALQCLPFLALPLALVSKVNCFTVARTLTGTLLGLGAYAAWLASLQH